MVFSAWNPGEIPKKKIQTVFEPNLRSCVGRLLKKSYNSSYKHTYSQVSSVDSAVYSINALIISWKQRDSVSSVVANRIETSAITDNIFINIVV